MYCRFSLCNICQTGRQESDTTERLYFHFSLSYIGEGNGSPLQCSCLENPRDGGAWWAAIYGVAQSRTRLKRLSSSSSSKSKGYRFGCETFSSLLSSYFSPIPGTPNWTNWKPENPPQKGCLRLSGNPNWDSNCLGLSGNPRRDSKCPHGGPNNSCLSTTSDYSGFSRNSPLM